MSEYVTLLGTEDVRHAGHNIQIAAGDIKGAISNLDEILFRYSQRVEEWMQRFEQCTERIENAMQRPSCPRCGGSGQVTLVFKSRSLGLSTDAIPTKIVPCPVCSAVPLKEAIDGSEG